ncbi:MAG TPA: undecaprenyl-diphosphatase, partial [Chromatiaceae bacterium]|nr:undecaprenyl-diphosphatase [Chromatiaceae bacterium]
SRSGITIACAMLLGIAPLAAARFSFLLSVPAIIGASLIEFVQHRDQFAHFLLWPLCLGFVAALLVGYISLQWFIPLVERGKLYLFAWYLIPVGLLATYLLW